MPGPIAATLVLLSFSLSLCADRADDRPPNIVFLIADDLGYGDVGCYGQTKIHTPRIDSLARDGSKFTAHYAGNNVCAPSRCVLMTGKHPGHAFIRDNREMRSRGFDEGQQPVPPGELRLPILVHESGYVLGGFGKWGLGPMGSTGDPLRQGFQRWFGYNCQAVAHNYYPTYLWDNETRVLLKNPPFPAHQKWKDGADPNDPQSYASFSGVEYAPDLIEAKALEFVDQNKDRPFFLFFPTTVPHLALQVPDDSLAEYAGKFEEKPYLGDRSYLPHRQPRAAYAAMITRMDRAIGRILDRLHDLGLESNTIVVFTSDNGPLYDQQGGTDADFFRSAGPFRGRKGSFYEGGYRVPCVVRWPGKIEAGRTIDRVTGFEDWLPTLLDLIGRHEQIPADLDGISFAPTLLGQSQPPRPFLYREMAGYGGQQAARVGDWKAIRKNLNPGPRAANPQASPIELYDLASDPGETRDVAADHPDLVAQMARIFREQHQPSTIFPMRALDEAPVGR